MSTLREELGTGSFPGIKCGRDVLLNTHPLLVPRSRKSRAILFRSVQGFLYLYSLTESHRNSYEHITIHNVPLSCQFGAPTQMRQACRT